MYNPVPWSYILDYRIETTSLFKNAIKILSISIIHIIY